MIILDEITKLLPHVSKPIQYVGGEINAIHKPWQEMGVRVGLCFPDTYEVGMSHLGLHLLYAILNDQADVVAERIYAPRVDMEHLMRKNGIALFSLESHKEAAEFDLLGFTLQYELSYSNILNMLSLAHIPLKSEDRAENEPFIIAGGPCSSNPEPLADFCDLFVIGDGESVIVQLVQAYKEWKHSGASRHEFLKSACGLPGVYVPSFYTVHYEKSGQIADIIPRIPEAADRIQRNVVTDLETVPYLQAPVVPYLKTVHDRLTLEIMRGCARGCRFCQAGFIYRPLRERSRETILELAKLLLAQSGYDEVSLSSLSTGDYTQISGLMMQVMEFCEASKIALSLPSMRAKTLTEEMAAVIRRVRKTGFTIAPEAGTQRLRNVVNKGISDDDILQTAEDAFTAGWELLKLYFMIGLPTETEADLEGIIDLVFRIKKLGNQVFKRHAGARGVRRASQTPGLNVSISSFVPKAHTPFQWDQFQRREDLKQKQYLLQRRLRHRLIQVKWPDVNTSYLEGVFARGDRRLGRVLFEAHRLGCQFDGWHEHFDFAKWMQAFASADLDPDFYVYRDRPEAEQFPWEHIHSGVSKTYLWDERLNAFRAETTPPCEPHCRRCGLCHSDITVQFSKTRDNDQGGKQKNQGDAAHSINSSLSPTIRPRVYRVRTLYYKTGLLRFLSQLDLVRVFQRAVARIKAPIAYSQGFHPLPQIAFGPALPVGTEGYQEYIDFTFTEYIDAHHFVKQMNATLPQGIGILGAYPVNHAEPSLSSTLKSFVYWGGAPEELVRQGYTADYFVHYLEEFQSKEVALVQKFRKKTEAVDIKPFIAALDVNTGDTGAPLIKMVLQTVSNMSLKPEEVLHLVFEIPYEKVLDFKIVRVSVGAENLD